METWIVLWLVMATIVAMVARSKGRPWPLWFIYGFALWPVALAHALLLREEGDTWPDR